MKVRSICAVVVGMVIMASVSGGAGLYLGGYGAYSFGGDVQDESLGYGVNLGLPLGESFGLELSGTLLEDSSEATDFDLGSIDLSLLYYFPLSDESLDLYLGVGASYNRFDFTSHIDREIQNDDQIGFFGELGVAVLPVKWLRIFADVRYNVMTYEVQDVEGLGRVDQDYNFFLVRVGAEFAL